MKIIDHIPCDKAIDSTAALLMEGYHFIPRRCCKYHTKLFQTRLMCQKVFCMSGEEAAKLFYNDRWFQREGAAPKRIQKSLFGENGVQALDGEEHIHRKLMFMSIMTRKNLERLARITEAYWRITSCKWKNDKKLVLFDEAQKIMCRTACQWAGVMLEDKQVCTRAKDLGKMVDAFGGVGPRYWKGKCARMRTEKWIESIITQVRTHKICPEEYTALYIIAWHRDNNGKLLNTKVAAVELINILRPIVAIATYITFGALALYQHPECRKRLQTGDDAYTLMFVQEVRRYFPFAPFVGAIVRRDFIWKNCYFKKGTRVLFDIYGTNHDRSIWKKPYAFRPERFNKWSDNRFTFVPQGGGETVNGHRCAGEGATIEIMKVSLSFLVNYMDYEVPKQNLKYSFCRIPCLPKSRFIIQKVKLIN